MTARPAFISVVVGLTISLFAIPFARGGGGSSADHTHLSPSHGLPDRAYSSHSHPPGSDQVIRALPCRSHSVALPHSHSHRPSGSSHPHQESTASLATRINNLAKDFRPRRRSGLATAVNQLPKDQRFYDAAPKHLGLLSNGIGKLLGGQNDQRAAIRVLNTLAREVSRRYLGGRSWQSQNLALVVNGLSKATGDNITGALKAVAREVVLRDLSHWTSQHVALVVCGIRRAEGAEITACMNVLAQEIARQDLHRWPSHHLAMVAAGICRAEGEALTMALTALAQAVNHRKPDLGRWADQHLAMVVNGLSKGVGEEITRTLNVLAQVVTDRRRALGQWTEQQLAMVVSGLSKGGGEEITEALRIVAQAVVAQERKLGLWTDQCLAMVISGISKATGAEITKCLNMLISEIAGRDLSQWIPQSLAMAAGGMGHISQNPVFSKLITELINCAVQEPLCLHLPAGLFRVSPDDSPDSDITDRQGVTGFQTTPVRKERASKGRWQQWDNRV